MAFFAEMAVMSEERGLPQVKTAADVPPERRVRMRSIDYNPGCLAEDAADANESSNPPVFTFVFTHPNSAEASVMHSLPMPLKRSHIASGFGDKSESWWPSGPACANSILDEEVDEEHRHNDGPFLGHVPFRVSERLSVRAQCYMTHLSMDLGG